MTEKSTLNCSKQLKEALKAEVSWKKLIEAQNIKLEYLKKSRKIDEAAEKSQKETERS